VKCITKKEPVGSEKPEKVS